MSKAVEMVEFDLKKKATDVLLFGNGISMSYGKASHVSLIDKIREQYSDVTGIRNYAEIESYPFPMQVVLELYGVSLRKTANKNQECLSHYKHCIDFIGNNK